MVCEVQQVLFLRSFLTIVQSDVSTLYAVSEEMGFPSLRGHLLDKDQHQEPRTQQKPRTEGNIPENKGLLLCVMARCRCLSGHVVSTCLTVAREVTVLNPQCRQFVYFSRKSLQYTALDMGYILTQSLDQLSLPPCQG